MSEHLSREYLEHLRELPSIQEAIRPFIATDPFAAEGPPAFDPEAMRVAFERQHAWDTKLVDICQRARGATS